MQKNRTQKKRPFGLFFLLGMALLLFLGRHALLRSGIDLVAHYLVPGVEVAYKAVAFEKKGFVLREVQVKDRGYAAAVHIGFDVSLSPLYLHTQVVLDDPELEMSAQGSFCGLTAFVPSKHFGLEVDVPQGRVAVGEDSLFFTLREKNLIFFYDPDLPLLSIHFDLESGNFVTDFEIQEVECAQALSLLSPLYSQIREGWEHIEGVVEARGRALLSPAFVLHELSGHVCLQNAKLLNSLLELDVEAENFQLDFAYPTQKNEADPFWKQIIASLSAKQGKMQLGEWGLFAETAMLALEPESDPSLSLKGSVVYKTQAFPLELEGKGFVHEDRSFWLELLATSEKEEGFFSLCSTEKGSYIFQADLKNIPIPSVEGGFASGKLTGWIQDGSVQRVQLEEVCGVNLPFSKDVVQAQGAFVPLKKGWQLTGSVQLTDTESIEVDYVWKEGWPSLYTGEGRFYSKALDLSRVSSSMTGLASLSATVNPREISMQLQADQCAYQHPHFDCCTSTRTQAFFTYGRSEKTWKASLAFKGADIREKNHGLVFENIDGELFCDEKSLQGTVHPLYDLSCALQVDFLAHQADLSFFDRDGEQARLILENSADRFILKPGSQVCGIQPSLGCFDREQKLLELDFTATGGELGRCASFFGFESAAFDLVREEYVEAQIQFCQDVLHFSAHVQGKERFCTGEKKGSEWQIHQLRWDALQASGNFQVTPQLLTIPFFEIHSGDFQCQAQAEVRGPFTDKVEMDFCLTSPLLSRSLAGSAFLQLDPFVIEGTLQEGAYPLWGRPWDLKEIAFLIDSQFYHLTAQTSYENIPFWINAGIDRLDPKGFMLHVREAPSSEGVRIFLKESLCESIQGSLMGSHADLIKTGDSQLTGSLQLDVGRLAPLLPKVFQESVQRFGVGSGYQFKGDISLQDASFKGHLSGEKCELFGYCLDRFDVDIERGAEQIQLFQLQVTDKAGSLVAPQVKLIKAGSWVFDIPLIHMQNVFPSKLKQAENPKPFCFPHISLTHLRGDIDDVSTFVGLGYFNFSNRTKKETNFLDIPLAFIKNLGLDPGLFTPIVGEVEGQLRGNKFYFTGLKNTFSEGERSQFYLFQEESPSFLTLDGKIHINLKMRQSVLLKLTEPLTIKVRGSVAKPSYSIIP